MGEQEKPQVKKSSYWKNATIIAAVIGAVGFVVVAIITGVFGIFTANITKTPPPPTPTLTSTPSPAPVNLLEHKGFDKGLGACAVKDHLTDKWCTNDPARIVTDKNTNGTISVKLVSNTGSQNTYLFSPLLTVDPNKNYLISYQVNLQQLANGKVVAPYIDEFDQKGDDLKTGSYRTLAEISKPTDGEKTITIPYKPNSSAAAFARMYFIVMGNSDTVAVVNNVTWTEDNQTSH